MWIPVIEPDDHHKAPEAFEPSLTVMGSREPYATNWFDPDGNQLWWVPEPMGFHCPLPLDHNLLG